jgi:PAS domain S-box-containing protein
VATRTTLPGQRLSRAWGYWSSLGIRSRILISLTLLMGLAAIGSVAVFVVTTNTTRNQLQNQQLDADFDRTTQTLAARRKEVVQAAQLLAADPELMRALRRYEEGEAATSLLDIDARALPIRDRFGLDQVLVLGSQDNRLVNLVSSAAYSTLSVPVLELLADDPPAPGEVRLLDTTPPLLIAASPISGGGRVVTGLALTAELTRIRYALDLSSTIDVLRDGVVIAGSDSADTSDTNQEQRRERVIVLGQDQLVLRLSLGNPQIDSIIAAGRDAMLLSVLTTFVVLLLLGARFAHTITRPIRRLTNVADAVGQGDWQQRANLTFDDEIGRLGRAFDHAAQTVTTLLTQRDQEASQRQAILQSITDGVLATDADERLLLVNPAAMQLLGWGAVPTGQTIAALLEHAEPASRGLEALAQQLRAALAAEAPSPFHTLLEGRDVLISCAPVRDKQQRVSGAVAVLHDITEAVAADRAKSQFIATASHELRTPLASLKGFADLLHLQGLRNLDEDQRYALGIIRRQADLLVLLVNDLLEVARLEQGQSSVQRRIVAPATTVQDVLEAITPDIDTHRHHLRVEVDDDLPALWIDPSHLRRMLINLLSNAIKYTPDGGHITIRGYVRDDEVVFAVEDDGVGIDPRDHGQIFTRFFRSENPLSVKAGGTGLGLAITKSMAELHGGTVGFTSVPGQGSCFVISLPVAERLEDSRYQLISQEVS